MTGPKKRTPILSEVPVPTDEEREMGMEIIDKPIEEFLPVDVSDKNIEKMARGFLLGTQSVGKRREVRQQLEEKVIGRIGKKGKYLTDKLFELIDGVYIIQNEGKDTVKYYKVPPNLSAITYALDRVLGKPASKVESSEEKKGVMLVESIIKNLAGGTVEHRRSIEVNK